MQAVVANEISLDATAAAGVRAQTARRFRPDGPTHPSPLPRGGGLGWLSLLNRSKAAADTAQLRGRQASPLLSTQGGGRPRGLIPSWKKDACASEFPPRAQTGEEWASVGKGPGGGEGGSVGWGREQRAGWAPAEGSARCLRVCSRWMSTWRAQRHHELVPAPP